jgi:predicted ATP-dependent endonuclease of OLD family
MLKKLTIKNFKAIEDMTIEFTPLTVLIGENGCGKSTVLQAIHFLDILIKNRDISKGLEVDEMYFFDLKSKYHEGGKNPIEFIAFFELKINGRTLNLMWSISIDEIKDKWKITEKIINNDNNDVLCSYKNDDIDDSPSLLNQIYLKSSALNILGDMVNQSEELMELSRFVSSIHNIGQLSVDKMRNKHK